MVLIIHYSSFQLKDFGLFLRLEFTREVKFVACQEVPKNYRKDSEAVVFT